MKTIVSFVLASLGLFCVACYHEEEIPVVINFEYVIPESYTVPVMLTLSNKTSGADFYRWTFAGATPSSSDKKEPGTITYTAAGEYKIILEAWNDTQRSSKEIVIKLDSVVTLDFDAIVLINNFSPVTTQITNHTRGASSYEWTFAGGVPETSYQADPGIVTFSTPGEHTIILKVSNGRETYSSSKSIIVSDALATDFDIVPTFEDEDYEAPLTATLQNKTISGLHYTWSSTNGVIADATAETTTIFFDSPGDYTITLTASNDKDSMPVDHVIHIKSNTNLYSIEDVKLGVSAAHSTLGCFYSTTLRNVLKKDDVTADNGKLVDLVFYGVNSSFSYCRFVSPDSASKFTYPVIPQAAHTYFINTLESSGSVSFTDADFEAMVNDNPLHSLDIKLNDTGTAFFSNSQVPRVVLFETGDGRKGAIRIKSFVPNGTQSYILADIKVQKLKQ